MRRDVKLLLRLLISDEEFLENMPYSLMDELISIEEPIPIRISSMVMDYCFDFNLRRVLIIEDNQYLKENYRNERMACRKLPPAESREYHNDFALDFIRKYPQFRPIISHVKIMDENLNEIETIPIDQYLAENKRVEPYNPFNSAKFDDSIISELNSKYCNGEITAEEYIDKLINK